MGCLQVLRQQSPVRAARLSFTGDLNKRLMLPFPISFSFFCGKKAKETETKEKEKRTLASTSHPVIWKSILIHLRIYCIYMML